MPIALPIELVVDHDALRRTDDAVVGRQKFARQGLGIRIDQPGLRIEAMPAFGIVRSVGLKVIELSRPHAGNEHAPDIAPAVQVGIELDDLPRIADRSLCRKASTRIAVAGG